MRDVFISYNSHDRPVVTQICRRLAERDIKPFLDILDLIPGQSWQGHLLKALDSYSSAAICFGPNGLGDVQRLERDIALNRHAKEGDRFPLIPVLLPGVDPSTAALGFLALNTWVDLRSLDDEEIDAFAAAVRGEKRRRTDRLASDLRAALNPYRGLAYFREDDAPLFFGREDFSNEVSRAVQTSRFVAIVGASGSGKSSIAHAGLLPKLRDPAGGRLWAIHTMVPGADPAGRLAEVLTRALNPEPDVSAAKLDAEMVENRARLVIEAEDHKGALGRLVREICRRRPGIERVLLLVDQFEEAFTLATPEKAEATARFIEELVLAADDPETPLTVVVTLRGDQYHQVTDRRALAALFAKCQVNVGPMTPDELRHAIVAPLEKVGGRFQHGLVDRIVADVGAETNALPLLEYALDALWTQRDQVSGELTHAAYKAMGGLKHAIAERANEIFDKLPPEQQTAARDILLALVRPGEGTLVSKRPADLGTAGPATEAAVAALAKERLIVADGRRIEIVHEALIREWGLLRGWVDEARGDLALRDRLEGDAKRWAALAEGDPAADSLLLPPGLRLEEGRQLVGEDAGVLAQFPVISNYIERSIAHDEACLAAERTRADAELARTKRENRRLQAAVVAAVMMLFVAAAAGIGIWRANNSLDRALADARAERDTAETETREAEAQKQLAQRNFATAETEKHEADVQKQLAQRNFEAAETEKHEADVQKQLAQRNFEAAKDAVDELIFDVAPALQVVAGMPTDTIRTILRAFGTTVDGLLATAPHDAELLRLKLAMLTKFVQIYVTAKDLNDALKAAYDSLDIARNLVAQDPDDAQAQRDVSISLKKIGDFKLQTDDKAAAVDYYQQSLDIDKSLAAPSDADAQLNLSISLDKIGDIKLKTGDPAGALDAYQQSLDIEKSLVAHNPSDIQAQFNLLISLETIGDVKLRYNEQAGAVDAFKQELAITKTLAEQEPADAQAQRDLSIRLNRIGDVMQKSDDKAGELDAYNQVLAIAKNLAAREPGNAQAKRDLSISLDNIGDIKLQAHDKPAALDAYKQSLDIRRTLAAQDSGNAEAQRDVFVSLTHIASVKAASRRAEALALFRKAAAIAEQLAALDKGDAQAARDLAWVRGQIAALTK